MMLKSDHALIAKSGAQGEHWMPGILSFFRFFSGFRFFLPPLSYAAHLRQGSSLLGGTL
jgi:hypothetical protein